jgi:hypothetical protein
MGSGPSGPGEAQGDEYADECADTAGDTARAQSGVASREPAAVHEMSEICCA